MDIAKDAQPGDATIEEDGLRVFLEQRAQEMLVNTTIDFQDRRGFVLSGGTPQDSCSSSSCSC